jgi:MYXO-CTERM domain-containing protein
MRFGHDPSPNIGHHDPGRHLRPGRRPEARRPFYDVNNPNKYFECEQGDNLKPPSTPSTRRRRQQVTGIGTWTRGALQFAQPTSTRRWPTTPPTATREPALRSILLLTDGVWTNQEGTQQLDAGHRQPGPGRRQSLFTCDDIPTYVVAIGEAEDKPFADELAMAGGTGAAYRRRQPAGPRRRPQGRHRQDPDRRAVAPSAPPASRASWSSSTPPRRCSTSTAAPSRRPPAGRLGPGPRRPRRRRLDLRHRPHNNSKVQDLVHLGLSVFGHNAPDEEKVLVQYGPCRKDNFAWALDPDLLRATRLHDPYAGPPITWTFQDGSIESIRRTSTTRPSATCRSATSAPSSPRPASAPAPTPTSASTSSRQHRDSYKAECSHDGPVYPCNDADRVHQHPHHRRQVQLDRRAGPDAAAAMYNAGITTYVIGFGDAVDNPARQDGRLGLGQHRHYYDANNQDQLEMSLKPTSSSSSPSTSAARSTAATMIPSRPPTSRIRWSGQTQSTTDPRRRRPTRTCTTVGRHHHRPDRHHHRSGPVHRPVDRPRRPTRRPPRPTRRPTRPSTRTATTGVNEPDPTTDPTTDPGDTTNPTATNRIRRRRGEREPAPSGSSGGDVGGVDDEGCGCKVDDTQGNTRGLLGTLLTLGLAGFLRRRRRA